MKKQLMIMVVVAICCALFATPAMASADSINNTASSHLTEAQTLKTLGLFLGTNKGLELERVAVRSESAVMMTRLLGKAEYADNNKPTHPFSDVPSWASPAVGYLYQSALAKGTGENTFGSSLDITANQYATYILRALDYDEDKNDFTWDAALEKYLSLNLLSEVDQKYFSNLDPDQGLTRNDLVALSYNALFANLKGSNVTLLQKLYVMDGAITMDRMILAKNTDARIASTVSELDLTSASLTGELSAEEIFNQSSPAVFLIRLYDKSGAYFAYGSGFFINNSGLAVTNYHVIDQAYSATITTTDGKSHQVNKVMGYNVANDIAIIQTSATANPYINMGNSEQISVGQQIYTIGSPLGLDNTLSSGIISNAAREVDNTTYIQITAPISSGSSGGVLLNTRGEAIGITTGGFADGQNLNLAVPINLAQTISQVSPLTLTEVAAKEQPLTTTSPSAGLPDVGEKMYDEEEPNDDSAHSNLLSNGVTVNATLSNKVDEDIYCIEANAKDRLIVLLTCDETCLPYFQMGLYSKESDSKFKLLAIAAVEDGLLTIDKQIDKTGTYYLRVLSNTADAKNNVDNSWYLMYVALV